MTNSQNLSLPLIMPAQAQKHVTHNEALIKLDEVIHLSVKQHNLSSPPPKVEGERYIVAAGATEDWMGHENEIACVRDGIWQYHTPKHGWNCYVEEGDFTLIYKSENWIKNTASLFQNVDMLGVNATADASNRFSLRSDASLFSNINGSHRMALNKAATSDVVSLLFQTGYSTKAEMGLTGSDMWQVKVSTDGTNFKPAITVDNSTRNVGIGTASPSAELEVVDSSGDGDCRIQLRANASHVAQIGVSTTQVFVDTTNNKSFLIYGNGVPRLMLNTQGYLSIGTTSPTTPLHVNGAMRAGVSTVANLPSASLSGSGALIFLSQSGSVFPIFSDGTNWRKMSDNSIV